MAEPSLSRFAQSVNKTAQPVPAPESSDEDNSDMDNESDVKINDDNSKLNGVDLQSTEEKSEQNTDKCLRRRARATRRC